jgi:DNA-binding beta-propeller fold protein YncE
MRRLTSLLTVVVIAVALTACGDERRGKSSIASASRQPTSATPPRTASTPASVTRADLEFFFPHGIAATPDGTVYVSDTDSSRVVQVDRKGKITLFAGQPDLHSFKGDGGPTTDALLHGPTGLAVDADGNLYIVDHGNNRVRMVDAQGVITTVAGSGTSGTRQGGSSGDGGPATKAMLQEPWVSLSTPPAVCSR